MSAVVILLIGMAVVVASVLALRVHAFLALIVAALIVSWLTPRNSVFEQDLRSRAVSVVEIRDDGTVELRLGSADGVAEGSVFLVMRAGPDGAVSSEIARLRVVHVESGQSHAQVFAAETKIQIEETDLIVAPTALPAAASLSNQSIGYHVATGFGRTCMGIGILIAMAAIIGKCLLDSGGAERVVLAARRRLGEERTASAFLGSSFVVAIPVFFDTVFYLLVPLAKAMRVKSGQHYLLYILTIVAGAALAHSLVPPTPGPLFVAHELGVDIGLMMLGGCAVGLVALPVGYVFAIWADRRWDIPLRPSAELSADELEAMANRDQRDLPPLWMSLMPILLPVVLIAGSTMYSLVGQGSTSSGSSEWMQWLESVIRVVGDKNVALVIAAGFALLLLVRQTGNNRIEITKAVQAALASGGVIILITAAGGSFGHVLRLTGIAQELKAMIPTAQFVLLPAAFAATMLVRVAQGSATVAMITAVGVFAPIVASGGLEFHPLYIALAIGCGSMPYPWMNDSGFWIISKMSGFTEAETLKTASAVMAIMGLAGFAATMLGAWWIPLV